MHKHYFEESINKDSIVNLVNELELKQGKVELWFSTVGGETTAMDYLLSYLNYRYKEIEIIIVDRLVSVGCKLLTDFKGIIRLYNNLDFILFHKMDREQYVLRKQEVSTKILSKQDEIDNKIFAKKLKKIGLTKKQINIFNKGKDLVLYRKDFKQLILNDKI